MKIISKIEAKSQDLKRYYTGEPCKRGHVSERKISSGDCIECVNLKSRVKCATDEQREKDKLYRSTEEYKRRKNYNKRVLDHKRIIDDSLKKLNNRKRACESYISKSDAKLYGLKYYFDGSLCKRGHMSKRQTSNGACNECCKVNAMKPERLVAKSEYYVNNKDLLLVRNVERQRERYAEDSEYRMGVAARNMLKRVLRAGKRVKNGGSYEMLGYDRDQLITHLEALFESGMSWDNYGDWHIDHVKPLSVMISEGVTDPSIINSLSNLQPLWAVDNLTKSNKVL